MSNKKEGVDPCSGKYQSISVGEYQDREVENSGCGNTGRENGLWDLRWAENQKKRNEM